MDESDLGVVIEPTDLPARAGIKLRYVVTPPPARHPGRARMPSCSADDLEGDKLYSIKWDRNGHEFNR